MQARDHRGVALGLALAGAGLCLAAPVDAAPGVTLEPVADVPLGGRPTRLDYLSFDPGRHLLFIAHLGDGAVIVFDTGDRRVVKRIAHVDGAHGVLALPELGRVYASATGSHEVVAIDASTLEITARIPAGVYPDGIAYAPEAHKLYVSDEHGDADVVIDTRTDQPIATIALGGEAGNTQYDPVSKHVFVNVQTRAQLVEIDPATDRVVDRIDLPGARGNHGLLIEPRQRLALIACEGNDRLLVVDLRTRSVTASFATAKDPDVLAYDPGLGLLYVAAESGTASLFKLDSGRVAKIRDAPVGPGAHVVGVDPATHDAYFPLMSLRGRTVLRILRPDL